jgi:PBP1b-binding outer membrane lipoprotein LpoB
MIANRLQMKGAGMSYREYHGPRWARPGLLLVWGSVILLAAATGCGPKAIRGGPGTSNRNLDEPAMSIGLDRQDIEYLASSNVAALSKSALWNDTIEKAPVPPLVAIWPIQNATTQHIEDQISALLSSVETYLVNSGDIGVVSRERQQELVKELRLRQSDIYDPQTAGKLGRQLGAQYFVTGKITCVDERLKDTRRVQYSLVLQIIEVETGLITFQNEAIRSKAMIH